jgi:tripartite-type tricarboxylate transporter receptor subunit TctC
VARAAPDGYTLQLAHINSNAIGPLLVSKGRFDPINDFTPITLIGITPQMLCHHPKHKFANVPDLIRYAKANPGKLSFASSGVGSIQHIAGEAFKLQAGVDLLHVPFKGTGEALAALISGDVDMTFSSTGSALPQVKANKLTLLAVCSPKRLPTFPDTPAVAETLPGYDISTWYGLAGPAKMPPEIVKRLNGEVQAILRQPDIAKRLQDLDAEVSTGSPEQFGTFWKKEIDKFRRIIDEAKITA